MSDIQLNKKKSWGEKWELMSDTSRIAVAVAFALACIPVVVLFSLSGPIWQAVASAVVSSLRKIRLTPETLAFLFLTLQYAVLVTYGWAHALRTKQAIAFQLPKKSKKPVVGDLATYCTVAVTLFYSLLWVVFFILNYQTKETFTAQEVFGTVFLAALFPWIPMALVLGMLASVLDDSGGLTQGTFIRTMGIIPGVVIVILGYTTVNLGMLIGLFVLGQLLSPLEDDELPKSYPESFKDINQDK